MNEEPIRKFIMKREDKFAIDHAGATGWGVSLRWLRSIPDLAGDLDGDGDVDADDILLVSQSMAWQLFTGHIFIPMGLEKLSDKLRMACMDTAVNVGAPECACIVQRAANRIVGGLAVDGVMGSHTLSALVVAGEDEVLPVMLIERQHFYKSLVDKNEKKYKQFFGGWVNRVLMLDRLLEGI